MIIPVRCYSCGKTIAHLYEPYRKLLDEDYSEAEALEAVGAVRYCCRRMLLTHIDLIDGLMPYSAPVVGTMQRIRPTTTAQQQQQQQPSQTRAPATGVATSSADAAAPTSGASSSVSAPTSARSGGTAPAAGKKT